MATKLKACTLIEQRAVIRFLRAEGNGREDITDEPRSGRPVDVSTSDTEAEVEKLIRSDRRLTIDDVAETMDISHGTAHNIVHKKLAFNKVSAHWAPKMLTDDHKAQRVMAARQCMRRLRKIEELAWELLVHPPYSPDLAPSDFHLFGPLKNHMRGKHFTTDAAVMEAVREWFRTQRLEFYSAGIEKLPGRWNKCMEKEGDYIEK
ncbi:uncharacterized protein [Watersipora subatra]|uniref:uncharacterized protein n=1 Tax=Watersipora subatra TaxID=2589382 RepID=UPI00355B4CF6